jgi:hypothetical protein
MGLMGWLRRVAGEEEPQPSARPSFDSFKPKPTPPPPTSAPPRPPRLTVKALAKQLAAEYPSGVPVDVLLRRSDAAGLDVQAVDDALDDIAEAAEIKVSVVDPRKLRIHDLSALDSTRTRIKGTSYWVTWEERRKFGGLEYLLICEPDNPVDPMAVAVYGKGRKVGHLSTAKAATFTPLLTELGCDAYRVSGVGATAASGVLWVDLPRVPAMRQHVKSRASQGAEQSRPTHSRWVVD